ncbi:MAG TPA: cupin domain-containing protein [Microbacterium sp.]|uniref:cupin domain-containing protein n=1 Tax=Microbacterium sp. TaxID=51671 RepID=UPI002BF2648A|nr:cupin domain-containing protein [Microbacterium sp.]HWI31806.1 cupin domain-containing protein [Microbacterium sp.]
MGRPPVRRVVTGHDDQGRAIILSDGPAPNTYDSTSIPGFGAAVAWHTPPGDIDHVTDDDPAGAESQIPAFPAEGETILRVADFPPDSVYPDDAESVIFSEIDGREAADAAGEHSGGRHFWFHRTDSLDYAVVLSGEITLLVDEGEATLRPGDVVIQRATSHAWSNRSERAARVLFVLIGTPVTSPAEIAAQRKAMSAAAGHS